MSILTTTSNWKSTIGGAFSALGSALMAVGIVPQLGGVPSTTLTYVALAGFICNAVGSFLGHLFAADAKTLADVSEVVAQNTKILQTVQGTGNGSTPTLQSPKVSGQ